MALNDRKHGSRCPEGRLSLTGTVAQVAPEYSEDEIEIEPIKDDAEFKAVSEVFMQMQAE